MKKLVCGALVCALFVCALWCAIFNTVSKSNTATVYAEEVSEEVPTEITDEELKDAAAETIAKINEYMGTANGYFANTILPLIISASGSLIMGLAVIIPAIKKNNKYKQLQGLYTRLIKENENLQTLLTSTDVTKIKDAMTELLGEKITEAMSKLKIGTEDFAEIKLALETLGAKLDAVKNGAANAWAGCPEAIAALTEAPDKAAMVALSVINQKLKQIIREKYGADGEKLICEAESLSV